MDLDDYSQFSHLSDAELLQLAIQRSLTDKVGVSSAVTHQNSNHRPGLPVPPANPQLPPASPAPAQPPVGPPRFLYTALKNNFTPLQSVIINGDAEALMMLVRRKCSSLMEPSDEGWIALHEAAYYGQLQCLRILIRAHPDLVNKCSPKGQTALLLAAARQKTSCVEYLLERGADPNIADKDGDTPLFKACDKPDERSVELLLKFGASVNRSCSQGMTALHEAARHGRLKMCSMLLQAGANLTAKNIYGIQPFFTAVQNGAVDILNFLIRKGADINGQAADGATPLYEACKNGHVSTVEMLLSHKADANRTTRSDLLPLHVAVQKGHTCIVSMLLPLTSKARVRRSGISPLHIAAERNRDEILELLIEAGFDVNAKLSEDRSKMYEDRRSTALYFSVYNRNLEAVELLLEAGASPNLDFFNPLLVAVRRGCMEMAMLLLSYGADVNAQISTQPSSFPSALLLSLDYLPMLKLLLDHGCDAASCFHCVYGNHPHCAATPTRRSEQLRYSTNTSPQHCIQFCEAISSPSTSQWAGPIISVLLDYVGNVRLCSGLLEHLDSYSDWADVQLKAAPPRPLLQLCRLNIRQQLGINRLKHVRRLPLPPRLISFLCYDVHRSLTSEL